MGLKELSKQLGVEYNVIENKTSQTLTVTVYSDKEKLWAYRESIQSTLAGLFKEVYADALDKMTESGNPFFLDNIKK